MRNRPFVISILILACVTGCRPVAPWTATPIAGASFTIQPPIAEYFRGLDPREQREQIRDWAVLGTVAHLGATPAQAAAATYELPPARLPDFSQLYSFEFGRGRRVYLNQRVLLFRDADDPDPQTTLGRLADRVRMENGELPSTAEVYLINDLGDDGLIRVDRAHDVASKELFSSVYGYVEGDVSDAASLTAWLENVDDLTYAKIGHDGHLRLGGRRFPNTRTANITAEDVAALYQAHEELDQPRRRAQQLLAELSPEPKVVVERYLELAKSGADSDTAWMDVVSAVPREDLGPTRDAISELFRKPRSPGFSLDTEWLPDPSAPQHPLMLARLRAFAADPCGEMLEIAVRAVTLEQAQPDPTRRTAWMAKAVAVRDAMIEASNELLPACARIRQVLSPQLRDIVADLELAPPDRWDYALVPYYRLRQQLSLGTTGLTGHAATLAYRAIWYDEENTKIQCGNYFGVKGTRVGMTLYYTDLLAKLWLMIDYARSSPTLDVPGFLTEPRLKIPPHLESVGDTHSRIWFGARASGVSRTVFGTDSAFVFDHRFTRIYAASNDPARPGFEEQPNERLRLALLWWDSHFDNVADYEQEYHRLNQITKWSLVTAALANSSDNRLVRKVNVRRGLEFRTWYTAYSENLRFAERLPAPEFARSCNECLPAIISYPFPVANGTYTIWGGVSTVASDAPAQVPTLKPGEPIGARRPHIDDLGAGKTGSASHPAPTLEDKKVTFKNNVERDPTTSQSSAADLRTVAEYGQGTGSDKLNIRMTAPEKVSGRRRTIGEFAVTQKAEQVEMEWNPGADERVRHQVPPEPATLEDADRLASNGDIAQAAKAYERMAPGKPETAIDLARRVIDDAARGRLDNVQRGVRRLAAAGKELSPSLIEGVKKAIEPVATSAALDRIEGVLFHGESPELLDNELVSEGQQLKTSKTRDVIKNSIRRSPMKEPPNVLDAEGVYVDDTFRRSRDGLVSDYGDNVSQLAARPDVSIEELDLNTIGELRDQIGELPDRIVGRSTKTTLRRVPVNGPWTSALQRSRSHVPHRVIVLRYNPPTRSGSQNERAQAAGPKPLPVRAPAANTPSQRTTSRGSKPEPTSEQGALMSSRCAQ